MGLLSHAGREIEIRIDARLLFCLCFRWLVSAALTVIGPKFGVKQIFNAVLK